MGIFIKEVWVNATENWISGESDVYETFTDKPGELFRSLQKEYGRCVSSMYVDTKEGKTRRVGWVFYKTMHYEDTREPYVLETWVSMHSGPDSVKVTPHYLEV